jgi:membrane dipeptidase
VYHSLDTVPRHQLEKGWHTKVRNPHLFIDGCVQVWPDADFDALREYGCTGLLVTSFMPHDTAGEALDALADWHRVAHTYPNVRIAEHAQDITAAQQAGQVAIILGSQGGDFLGHTLPRLEMFHRLGLRVMIPAYNARTPLADGLLEPGNAGLSRLGFEWVDECNRLGVLIDCTHVGEHSTLDILGRTKKPVVFTHSNPKALIANARNITDEQMRRCADGGGVVGVTNWAPLNFNVTRGTRPTLTDFLDAVDYTVKLIGIDHVGIGTDMSHGTYPDGDLVRGHKLAGAFAELIEANPRSRLRHVDGFDNYGEILKVTDAMAKRGHSEDAIEKILGRNLLRVFGDVW